jgi:hypothetical protein
VEVAVGAGRCGSQGGLERGERRGIGWECERGLL